MANRMLLAVDPQVDFISGTLPVPGAEQAMQRLSSHLLGSPGAYSLKVVTLDFHPATHSSFTANGGQWPRHCQRHTIGAAIWPALVDALHGTPGNVEILCKGQDPDRDEYSIFQNAQGCSRLEKLIQEHDIGLIDICGIAGDVCVLNTLKDGVGIFGAGLFNVLETMTASLDGGRALGDFMGRLK